MVDTFLLFTVDGHCFGVEIDEIVRVYPALEIDEVSVGPPLLSGLFTVSGRKIPVLNLRRRLQLPERPAVPDDILVTGRFDNDEFAFFVDFLVGVHTLPADKIFAAQAIYPELGGHVSRITDFSGQTVWIYTLTALFAEADFPALIAALANAEGLE